MGKFYVYLIFRPNWIPCYVGKGHGGRWLVHFRKCYNPHLAAIIAKAGGRLPVIKLDENLAGREAEKLEKRYIRIIGREMRGGPLVNQTDGGDGVVGRSPEACARHGRLMKGRKHTSTHKEKIRLGGIGKHHWTEEMRAALSAKKMGKKLSLEHRAKLSAAKKGKPSNMSGKHHTEEAKAKNRAAHLGKSHSEEHKKRIGEALKGKRLTEEHRLAIQRSWDIRRKMYG